jgi:hypothetical protein
MDLFKVEKMKKFIPLFFLIIFFLSIKIANNGIRLSDTNIYSNIADQMLHGKIIYKDIFFSNFPLFSYISFFYYLITFKNIYLFYFTSAIEISIIISFIYLITYQKTKNIIISITSSTLYALSFIVLSTSDHQTGVFTASLFAVISYFFLQKKRILISGIFISLAILTKAYFLPIFLSFLIYFALKRNWKNLFNFIIFFIITSILILLPSLIQAPQQLISDIFGFSLTRPIGTSKVNIAFFYIIRDFSLFIILLFNVFNIRKNILFALISIFTIVFFFGYQDVYYLYLNFSTPFLCLSFYEIYDFINKKFNLQGLVIPTIAFVLVLLNIITYMLSYRNLGKIENFEKIISTIVSENPKFLYGINDITPALITLTNIPALENVNDAHVYFFARGIYDKKYLTEKAIKNKTIVVAHGAYYPELNIKQEILDDILIKEAIYNNCKNILSIPVLSEGQANRINLFKCY